MQLSLHAWFHMLAENPDYGLKAPESGDSSSVWFTVAVPTIKATHQKSEKPVSPIIEQLVLIFVIMS